MHRLKGMHVTWGCSCQGTAERPSIAAATIAGAKCAGQRATAHSPTSLRRYKLTGRPRRTSSVDEPLLVSLRRGVSCMPPNGRGPGAALGGTGRSSRMRCTPLNLIGSHDAKLRASRRIPQENVAVHQRVAVGGELWPAMPRTTRVQMESVSVARHGITRRACRSIDRSGGADFLSL